MNVCLCVCVRTCPVAYLYVAAHNISVRHNRYALSTVLNRTYLAKGHSMYNIQIDRLGTVGLGDNCSIH